MTIASAAIGLVAAGCGSSPAPSGSASKQQQSPANAAYAYARCIRSHGVTNFPDPVVHTTATGGSISQALPASVGKSPAFKQARLACASLQPGGPNGGQDQGGPGKTVMLAFARCLRAHGINNFPDPTAQGRLSLPMIASAGVDVHTHAFFVAGRACVPVTHGAITVANIAQLVNHRGS